MHDSRRSRGSGTTRTTPSRRRSSGGRDSAAAATPKWAASLPSPLLAVIRFLLLSQMRPGDDYHTAIRKHALAVAPAAALAMFLVFALDVASGALSADAGPGKLMAVLAVPLAGLVFIMGFLIVKCSPKHDAAATDAVLLCSVIVNGISAISDVTYPVWAASTMIAFVPLLFRSPRAPLVLAMCACVFCVSTYNTAQVPPDEHAVGGLAAVPSPFFRMSAAGRVAPCVNIALLAIFALVIVEAVMRESERRAVAAKASLDVAAAIADALLDYDTSLARRVIDQARGEGAGNDALLERFVVIVANLDRYRPHLPNWLVRDDSTHPAASADDAGQNGGHSDTSSIAAARPRGGKAGIGRRRESQQSLSSSVGSMHSVYGGRSLGVESPRGQRIRHTSGSFECEDADGGASERSAHYVVESLTVPLAVQPGTPFKARVALAEVAFSIPSASELRDARGLPDVAAAVPLMAAAGHAFVDRVHRLAGGTSGAVHAFVGDVARVSWNAAAKAVQPEAKAARFLARLKHDAGHELVRAWGAAATGDARVQLAGSRQQALLVTASGGGSEALRTGMVLAKRHCAFVVDGATYHVARHSVDFRGCGFVAPSADGQQRGTGLFAIAREVPDVVEDWAYHATSNNKGEDDRYTEPSQLDVALCDAARLAATGNFSAAADALEAAERHVQPNSPSSVVLSVDRPSDFRVTPPSNAIALHTTETDEAPTVGTCRSAQEPPTTVRSPVGPTGWTAPPAAAVRLFEDLTVEVHRALSATASPMLFPVQ